MAELRVHDSDGGVEQTLNDPAEIAEYTGRYGVDFEQWNIDKLQTDEPQDLEVEDEQERVLTVFHDEVEQLKEEGNYNLVDVVALSPETPNLDELLNKFDKEHHHEEDEVRFVVDGRGVFTIHAEDDTVFDVELHPGDLIVIPDGTKHWFTLCEDKQIQCIRFFQSEGGWEAKYDD